MSSHRAFSLALLALLPFPTLAAPPTLANVQPRGGPRGVPVVVTLTGANLPASTRLVFPFKAIQKSLPDAKPNPAQVRLEVVVDPAVTPGLYPVRAVGDEGVSAVQFFRVDTLPTVLEVEDNNSFEKAQKLTWPVALEGQCAGGDVDFFRFSARKGQRLVVEVESARLGSGVLPQIRLTDASKRLLASDDSQALAGDVRIPFVVPSDGDFVVELSDARYRGGNPPFYRLRIADLDFPSSVFPLGGRRGDRVSFTLEGGSLDKPIASTHELAPTAPLSGRMLLPLPGLRTGGLPPLVAVGELPEQILLRKPGDVSVQEVKPPLVVNGKLDQPGQIDRLRFAAPGGSRWRLSVEAEALGSRLDGVLTVRDDRNRQLAQVDDVDLPPPAPGQPGIRTSDPSTEVTLPADAKMLLVELRDQRGRGGIGFGYRLTIEPAGEEFGITVNATELNVPRAGAVALSVPVVRRGYLGPIRLVVPDAPPGYRIQGGTVPAGATAGVLTIRADAAPGEPVLVSVEGRANIAGKEVRQVATQRLVVSREAGSAGVMSLSRLLLARTTEAPFQVVGPASITLVKGYAVEVPVKLVRGKGQEKLSLLVTPVLPGPVAGPTGFALKPAPATTASEARFSLTAGINVPEGPAELAVTASGRVGPRQLTVATGAITLTVKPPFEVQLSTPRVVFEKGQSVKLTGKIVRQAVCKEPVRLALAGLPPGVRLAGAIPPVAPGTGDFAIELKVDPKTKPAPAKLTLTASATVGGMNYVAGGVTVTTESSGK